MGVGLWVFLEKRNIQKKQGSANRGEENPGAKTLLGSRHRSQIPLRRSTEFRGKKMSMWVWFIKENKQTTNHPREEERQNPKENENENENENGEGRGVRPLYIYGEGKTSGER